MDSTMTQQGNLISDVYLAEVTGKFESLLGRDLSQQIVAVCFNNPIHFIGACLAVFNLNGSVLPAEEWNISDIESDLLLIDVDIDLDIDLDINPIVIRADLDSVVKFSMSANKTVGDIWMFDCVSTTLINKEKIQNWINFNRFVAQIDCSNTVFIYRDIADFFSFGWLLPLLLQSALTIAHIDENIEFKNKMTVMLPLIEIDKILHVEELSEATIITFGDEKLEYMQRKEIFIERSINWFNYYGFPHVTWLSAVKNFVIHGKPGLYHEIKPIKNISLTIINEADQVQPDNVIGFMAEESNGMRLTTKYLGLRLTNGRVACVGCTNDLIYSNGRYINLKKVEDALNAIEGIQDYYIKDNKIFYSSNIEMSGFELENEFEAALPVNNFEWDFIELPCVPRNFLGEVDTDKLSDGIPYSLLRDISSELLNHEIDNAIAVKYLNKEKGIHFRYVAEQISVQSEVASYEAYIKTSELDISKDNCLSLTELLEMRAVSNQNIIYMDLDGRVEQTYGELYSNAKALAKGLQELGVKANSKVILQLSKNKDYLEAFWACILIGAVPAPLAVLDDYGVTKLNANKLLGICSLLEDAAIITSTELVINVTKLMESCNNHINVINFSAINRADNLNEFYTWKLEEPCMLMFTSGSTGVPKGVILNQKNIFSRTLGEIRLFGFDEREVDLNWMTLTHAAGLIWTHIRDMYLDILQIQVQSELILNDPLLWIELMSEYRATITWAPNFAYSLVHNELKENEDYGWDLSALKNIFATAEANVSRNLRRFLSVLIKYNLSEDALKPAFGMTETSSVIIYNTDFSLQNSSDMDQFVAIGTPIAGHEFRVVDDYGIVVNEGVIGNIEGRGQAVTSGYYNNNKANKEAFTADHYFRTGDLGFIKDRKIVLTGRAKDLIIINGLNYYVQDIEATVDELEEVNSSYTVATSVVNKQGAEEIMVIFTPANEDVIDNIDLLKRLVQKIKHEIRKKCNVYPTYVLPEVSSRSIRTELGKKQRSKYRAAFSNGQYNEIIQKIEGVYPLDNYILEEFWQRKSISGTSKIRSSTEIAVVAKTGSFADLLFKNKAIKYKVYRGDEIPHIDQEAKFIVDLISLENNNSDGIAFSTQVFKHFAEYASFKSKVKIIIPSINALVNGDDLKFNEQNGILRGFIKSFNLENPNKLCKLIDFDNVHEDSLIAEMFSSSRESEVMYRNGDRFHSFFKSVPTTVGTDAAFQQGCVVLLLGGLGGIGKKLSHYLLSKYKVKLIIFGSRNLEDERRDEFNKLLQISQNVIYRKIDVNDPQEMQKMLLECEREFGGDTKVMINLAGKISAAEDQGSHWEHLSNHRIEHENEYSIHEVLKAKVTSTIALEKLRARRQETLLILFGSVNGYFGGSSLAAYSAANSFQDMYCKYLNNNGKKTLCMNWSRWADLGMSENIPDSLQKISSRSGYYSLLYDENLNYFDYIIENDIQNAIVGVDRNNISNRSRIIDKYSFNIDIYYTGDYAEKVREFVSARFKYTPITYKKVEMIARKSDSVHDIDFSSLKYMKGGPGTEFNLATASQEIIKMLEIWREVLKVHSIGVSDDFFDLGGNSILITKLLFKIYEVFNISITFQDVINIGTIEGLVNFINHSKNNSLRKIEERDINLNDMIQSEVNLQFPIERYLLDAKLVNKDCNLLLTGATGFLGAFLLRYLLSETKYHIYVLVRAQDEKDAEARVVENLRTYSLQYAFIPNRVTFVKGDIASLYLGCNQKEYEKLSEEIDIVVHAAAAVNFISPYDALKNSNVEGTRKLIKFASNRKIKPFHFISSYTVYDCLKYKANYKANERTKPGFESENLNGYTLTKNVSDHIVRLADEQGLPCKIYRIGTVTGDTQNGRCQVKDFFWLLVSASLKLKKVPYLKNIGFFLVPADSLAYSIVKLLNAPYDPNANVFNLEYDKFFIDEIFDWLTRVESGLQKVSYGEWLQELVAYAGEHEDISLLSILGAFPQVEALENLKLVDVDSTFTHNVLTKLDLPNHVMNDEVFRKTFMYLKQINFL